MSLNKNRNVGLMDSPRTESLQESQWMQQVTEAVRQGLGQQGDEKQKWLTWDDLEENKIVVPAPGQGGGYLPGEGGGGTEPPDMSPPNPLLNLEARGGMTAIRILWDDPNIHYYYRVEVHKSATDDLGEAFLVGTTQGNIFQDVVGSDETTWYYWARVIKQVGSTTIEGPWNKTQGTPAAASSDPDWILKDLEGKIDDSHLNDRLSDDIDKIPRIDGEVSDIEDNIKDIEKGVDDIEDSIKKIDVDLDGIGDSIRDINVDISTLETGLNTETEERQSEDESIYKRIDTNVARIGDNAAAIINESETRVTEDEALARSITTLKSEVDDNSAAIQTESETRATEDEALASQITTLKAEVGDNSAAIQSESEVRASEDEVLAKRIDTNIVNIGDNTAAIVVESETRATEDEVLAKQITTLGAEVGDNATAIERESEVRATEDEALAKEITTLQAEVDGNTAAIQSESQVRATEDEVLAKRIDTQTARVDDNAAAIQTESETRATEDEALARQITTLAAEVDDNSAAIQSESEVRASEDEVLASRITTMQAEVDGNKASIQTESEVRASEDEVLAKRIDTQVVRIDDNAAAIQSESEVRATEDEALAKSITLLTAEVGDNRAAIQTESETRATEDEALASQITQLEAEVDGNFAGIRDEMQVIISDSKKLATRVGTVELDLDETKGAIEQQFKVFEDEFENIRAEYTVKLDVDGYVGGFGLVNSGGVITALWRVDVFGIGSPGSDDLVFAVDAEEGRVVMDGAYIKTASINSAQIGELDVDRIVGGTADFVEANIREGSITNLKIGNVIQSNNYAAGKSGWLINKGGKAEFHDIYARGHIEGSIIRGSVIEGGLLIQSDIQITTPTEADRGAGTTRYLSLVTSRELTATRTGSARSLKSTVLALVSANYTAEGYEEYGDGDAKEPVWKNFDRYLKYNINPELIFTIKSDNAYMTNTTFAFNIEINTVNSSNNENRIYNGSVITITTSNATNTWVYGTFSGGTYRAFIRRQSWMLDDGTIVYTYHLDNAEVTFSPLPNMRMSGNNLKGVIAVVSLASSTRDTIKVNSVTIKDTLSKYV